MPFNDPQLVLYLVAAFLLGILLTSLIAIGVTNRSKAKALEQMEKSHQEKLSLLQQQLEQQVGTFEQLKTEHENIKQQQLQNQLTLGQLEQQAQQIPPLQREKQHWQQQYQHSQQQLSDLRADLQAAKAGFEQERLAADDKLKTLTESESRLKQEFENLANKIFEQKSQSFAQSNKAGLDALLNPLKDQIDGFRKHITDQYVKEGQERSALKSEILGLKQLNQQITQEAAALTQALKGDNKQQGNWGELVLERILAESGLREGHEFETQVSMQNEQGKKYQPDVLVHLPNDKDIVIDAKVSLSAYQNYFHAEDEVDKKRFLNEHLASLKGHIKGLGAKDYQNLQGLRTLDYVLMFVPVEPAFLLAVDQAPELIQQALDNNIMLVSPTNLLVALRTIHNIWQVEQQNQNAQKIASQAGALYDKFVNFTDDLQGIGTSLQTVQKKYDAALNKLSEGKGNLIRRTEELKKLGVQSSKKIDGKLLDKAQVEEE